MWTFVILVSPDTYQVHLKFTSFVLADVYTTTQNKYMLTVVDEYSRYAFAYPCKDETAKTVIKHLTAPIHIFSILGAGGTLRKKAILNFARDRKHARGARVFQLIDIRNCN